MYKYINNIIGGVLLISGTAIGAGMIALPTQTVKSGFFPTIAGFILCWFFMTIAALLILEINLYFKHKAATDLISLASYTLGPIGKLITAIVYLLLLYSLMCAYFVGANNWLCQLATRGFACELEFSNFSSLAVIIVAVSLTIAFGTKRADKINRWLTAVLFISYFALVLTTLPKINPAGYLHHDINFLSSSLPLIVTAFGYAIVIPTLVPYLEYKRKSLVIVILVGSTIPLIFYTLWELVIAGTIFADPGYNAQFMSISSDQDPIALTSAALTDITNNSWIGMYAHAFTISALLTSFLGIALSLYHFLGDLFRFRHINSLRRLLLLSLIFIPPMIILATIPSGLAMLLSFAGIFVAMLLGILPVMMAWSERYIKNSPLEWHVPGGKLLLIITGVFFIGIALIELNKFIG